MLEMSRCLYTGGNFKQNFIEKKIDRNLMVLFQIIILLVNDMVPISLSNIFCDHCTHDGRFCIRKILTIREMVRFQK